MIQRHVPAFLCRRRRKKAIQTRKKAATIIQSRFRGYAVRKITKYGVGYDIDLAKDVKTMLEQHEQKLKPYDYRLSRPAFKELKSRKIATRKNYAGQGEYSGQLDESGSKPEGRGIMRYTNGAFFEGRWSSGGTREHGRGLNSAGTDVYVG